MELGHLEQPPSEPSS